MKKTFLPYSIIWAICLAVFNVIVFVSPNEAAGMNKFGGAFWVGYIFITIAFVGQLACTLYAFIPNNLKKTFYKIPVVSISYTSLVVMLIAGTACMAIPDLPNWIGIVICVAILAFNAIAIVKATAAAEIVSGIDEKIQAQNFFIKKLTADAQSLMASAKSDEIRARAKSVYEAIRYSDPMSNAALFDVDAQIERQFTAFADAIKAEDLELAKNTVDTLIEMVEERNRKCKLLK